MSPGALYAREKRPCFFSPKKTQCPSNQIKQAEPAKVDRKAPELSVPVQLPHLFGPSTERFTPARSAVYFPQKTMSALFRSVDA